MAPIIYLTNDTTPSNICNPLNDNLFLEVTIKSYKTCKLEDVIIILLLELVAPMPSGCQPGTNPNTPHINEELIELNEFSTGKSKTPAFHGRA